MENRIILNANEGMVLTNGETFGKEIYLGCNDEKENWYEITDEEAEKIQEEANKNIEELN